MPKKHDTVVIVDFGAINNQEIAKTVRNLNIYCEVVSREANDQRIKDLSPKAIILQRGAHYGEKTLEQPAKANLAALDIPILDLATLKPTSPDDWNRERDQSVRDFLIETCKLERKWTVASFIDETIADLRARVGDGRVLLAMSGGVDSAVCAMLLHKAIGDQLTSVFVDNGLMRKDEPRQVGSLFRDHFGLNLVVVDGEARFLEALKGMRDPEGKRKIIGTEFIRVFEEQARKLGTHEYLAQGTIYPDIIESGSAKGKTIKSHHNVGGLPEIIDFKEILEPLKYLFKDEVRAVGASLGLPPEITHRQPFPGPGLGVRCLGELNKEKLDILREAEALFQNAMTAHGHDKNASQYYAALLDVRSVGMVNNVRTYGYTIALRAVETVDFMTAKPVALPFEFLAEVADKIARQVRGVSRVVYDLTGKPPATIEWE